MRKNLKTVWGATLVGMAGLVASAIVSGAAEKAEAGDKRQSGPSARQAPVAYASDHQSVIRISNRDPLPVSKGIRLGRNKSVVVELPRDLRDVVVSAPR